MPEDVYRLSNDRVLDPPRNFLGKLKHLGPGFILSASIVGSGELIATTNFGAEAGFVCLWVIILSCVVKVTLQLEFGKHAIYSGKTTIGAFNDLPGPKLGKASWSIWAWLLAMTLKFLQVGGIIGLVAMVCQTLLPIAPESAQLGRVVWTIVAGLVVAFLIARGRYTLIERTFLHRSSADQTGNSAQTFDSLKIVFHTKSDEFIPIFARARRYVRFAGAFAAVCRNSLDRNLQNESVKPFIGN
jgi:hypothetical protein